MANIISHRTKVLAAYKELLSLIRRLPSGDRQTQALVEARQTMRQHVGEIHPDQQLNLFKQLAAKISFLRTITPRRPSDVSSIGAGHFVLRDGQLVEGAGATSGKRVADGTMSMSDAYQKHQQLLQRQHYGRAPPKYDPTSF